MRCRHRRSTTTHPPPSCLLPPPSITHHPSPITHPTTTKYPHSFFILTWTIRPEVLAMSYSTSVGKLCSCFLLLSHSSSLFRLHPPSFGVRARSHLSRRPRSSTLEVHHFTTMRHRTVTAGYLSSSETPAVSMIRMTLIVGALVALWISNPANRLIMSNFRRPTTNWGPFSVEVSFPRLRIYAMGSEFGCRYDDNLLCRHLADHLYLAPGKEAFPAARTAYMFCLSCILHASLLSFALQRPLETGVFVGDAFLSVLQPDGGRRLVSLALTWMTSSVFLYPALVCMFEMTSVQSKGSLLSVFAKKDFNFYISAWLLITLAGLSSWAVRTLIWKRRVMGGAWSTAVMAAALGYYRVTASYAWTLESTHWTLPSGILVSPLAMTWAVFVYHVIFAGIPVSCEWAIAHLLGAALGDYHVEHHTVFGLWNHVQRTFEGTIAALFGSARGRDEL